jgi:hypothetical protein
MQGRIARPRRLWYTFLPKGEDGYEADSTQGRGGGPADAFADF